MGTLLRVLGRYYRWQLRVAICVLVLLRVLPAGLATPMLRRARRTSTPSITACGCTCRGIGR